MAEPHQGQTQRVPSPSVSLGMNQGVLHQVISISGHSQPKQEEKRKKHLLSTGAVHTQQLGGRSGALPVLCSCETHLECCKQFWCHLHEKDMELLWQGRRRIKNWSNLPMETG